MFVLVFLITAGLCGYRYWRYITANWQHAFECCFSDIDETIGGFVWLSDWEWRSGTPEQRVPHQERTVQISKNCCWQTCTFSTGRNYAELIFFYVAESQTKNEKNVPAFYIIIMNKWWIEWKAQKCVYSLLWSSSTTWMGIKV